MQHHPSARPLLATAVLALAGLLPGCGAPPDGAERSASAASVPSVVDPARCGTAAMFAHVASARSVREYPHATEVDHPALNGDAGAMPVVTPNFTPDGGPLVASYHPVGVWFNERNGRWYVYNSDGAPMPAGTGFNVRVGKALVTQVSAGSASANHFLGPLNGPDTRAFVTASYNPSLRPGTSNNWSPLVLTYAGAPYVPNWTLGASDGTNFNPSAFHVGVDACASLTPETTAAGIVGGVDAILDHPAANGDERAVVLVQRRLNADEERARVGSADPGFLAVHYDRARARWLVRGWHNGFMAMPPRARFNVLVEGSR